jgi:hypothetical protein
MRRSGLLLWIVLALVLTGCAGETPDADRASSESTTSVSNDDLVTRAAEITKAMNADPSAVERILETHGVTPEEFEEMMYEIAADPALSQAYEAALAE